MEPIYAKDLMKKWKMTDDMDFVQYLSEHLPTLYRPLGPNGYILVDGKEFGDDGKPLVEARECVFVLDRDDGTRLFETEGRAVFDRDGNPVPPDRGIVPGLVLYDRSTGRPFDFDILWTEAGRAVVWNRLDDVYFHLNNVDAFEKLHPELLRAALYLPLKGEKPIWGYVKIAKHMGVSIQTVKKNYKPQGAPIENINRRMRAFPSCLEKWSSDAGKKGKKK